MKIVEVILQKVRIQLRIAWPSSPHYFFSICEDAAVPVTVGERALTPPPERPDCARDFFHALGNTAGQELGFPSAFKSRIPALKRCYFSLEMLDGQAEKQS